MKDQDVSEDSFRDKISTVSKEGKRVWVFPKKPKGRLYNTRTWVAVVLLAFLLIAPHLRFKDDPLILLNILERKFIIFGIIIWPQDFHIIVMSIISLLVFIILFTVVFGRIFCGWVCPQTIFMEFVFRRIEYWIEGDYNDQKKLNRQEWNFDKIWKKTLKQTVFFIISFIIANTFLSYIIGSDRLKVLITDGPMAHLTSFIAVFAFSGVFYFIFAFFREQVCLIACPYGRLQGVLLDSKSIVVAYDHKRGEPKGKYNPLEDRLTSGKGDCIDCSGCMVVCPTSIDIRNGTQLECINCTACIDACDAIMDKIGRPRGLIRYDSENGISEGVRSVFNPRSIAYSGVLTVLLLMVASVLIFRTEFETTILRQKGTLFQEYGEIGYSNIYQVEIVNKTRDRHHVVIRLLEPKGEVITMGEPIVAEKGNVAKGTFLVVIAKDQLYSSNTLLKFGIYSGDRMIEEYEASFVGPNSLDKK
ncbi:MAG: cytochrome c oxidase accessory protein CcoG [Bacteroidetes bacterium]|nr:cytochrome c oxidase accessory protein CcoG [Bacteroidota bacterium]